LYPKTICLILHPEFWFHMDVAGFDGSLEGLSLHDLSGSTFPTHAGHPVSVLRCPLKILYQCRFYDLTRRSSVFRTCLPPTPLLSICFFLGFPSPLFSLFLFVHRFLGLHLMTGVWQFFGSNGFLTEGLSYSLFFFPKFYLLRYRRARSGSGLLRTSLCFFPQVSAFDPGTFF